MVKLCWYETWWWQFGLSHKSHILHSITFCHHSYKKVSYTLNLYCNLQPLPVPRALNSGLKGLTILHAIFGRLTTLNVGLYIFLDVPPFWSDPVMFSWRICCYFFNRCRKCHKMECIESSGSGMHTPPPGEMAAPGRPGPKNFQECPAPPSQFHRPTCFWKWVGPTKALRAPNSTLEPFFSPKMHCNP